MDPSTEQLIRDYLNRLAVAARDLGTDERMAFLARMHDSIERVAGPQSQLSPAEVASVLAELGEPSGLVDAERARLAGRPEPGQAASPPPADPAAAGRRPPADPGGPPGAPGAEGPPSGSFGGRLLRLPGKPRRNAGPRREARPVSAGPGPALTAAEQAIRHQQEIRRQLAISGRSASARRKRAETRTDKPGAGQGAVRPRGLPASDSPVRSPRPRNPGSGPDPAGAEPQRPRQPDAADQSGTGMAFVIEPSTDPQRQPVAVPRFRPAREPAPWPALPPQRRGRPEPGSGPGPAEGPEPGPEPSPRRGNGSGLTEGPEPGPEPAADPGPRPGNGSGPGMGPVPDPGPANGTGPRQGPEPDPARANGTGPRQGPEPGPARANGTGPRTGPGPGADPAPPDGRAGGRAALSAAAAAAARGWESVTAVVGPFALQAWVLARRHPLECAAIILLGLGGLIYPPVWLLGAVLALPSRLWDTRDKLIGLAAPAMLAIIGGAGLATAVSSNHTSGTAYLHTALVIGGFLIRAGAVLGAAYLGWRVRRGQRQPAPPSWHRND
jgi:hypothetical protein